MSPHAAYGNLAQSSGSLPWTTSQRGKNGAGLHCVLPICLKLSLSLCQPKCVWDSLRRDPALQGGIAGPGGSQTPARGCAAHAVLWASPKSVSPLSPHPRHPVRHIAFNSHSLVTANVPYERVVRNSDLDSFATHRRSAGPGWGRICHAHRTVSAGFH